MCSHLSAKLETNLVSQLFFAGRGGEVKGEFHNSIKGSPSFQGCGFIYIMSDCSDEGGYDTLVIDLSNVYFDVEMSVELRGFIFISVFSKKRS